MRSCFSFFKGCHPVGMDLFIIFQCTQLFYKDREWNPQKYHKRDLNCRPLEWRFSFNCSMTKKNSCFSVFVLSSPTNQFIFNLACLKAPLTLVEYLKQKYFYANLLSVLYLFLNLCVTSPPLLNPVHDTHFKHFQR